MINKILKNLKKSEEKFKDVANDSNSSLKNASLHSKSGFHPKKNSFIGAKRQRSIGNRPSKAS
jgi:hypothetical protein